MIFKRTMCAALFAAVGISSGTFTHADDTELYVFESSARTGVRPKILIIFDNSGSMSTLEEGSPADYDPDKVYDAVGDSHSYQGRMLYYTKGGIDNTSLPIPDSPSEARRFLGDINGCHQSWDALDTYGRFTGYLREYVVKGKTGEWQEMPENNGANIEIVDCWEDIEAKDKKNAPGTSSGTGAVADGYPVDAKKVSNQAVAYNFVPPMAESTALEAATKTGFGTGAPVTLYTDNYLRWYELVQRGEIPNAPKTRLEIAQKAITDFISTNTSVDFGLAIFNLNYKEEGERDGGRIVSGIRQMTPSAKTSLMSTINQLPAETNTPLCETMYEAYSYFSGGAVVYGHSDSDYIFLKGNKYQSNVPSYDDSIESGGNYISPMRVCPDRAYIIYITDGIPTVDQNADGRVETLTAEANPEGDYSAFEDENGRFEDSYLPALASYMFNNDLVKKPDDTGVDQFQNVMTFTIGFSDGATAAAGLLGETAKRGGGKYFNAKTGVELGESLNKALTSILAVDSSFTSPSIASNNFDRTQTFDSAYYAMFLPSAGPRWSGNLKKLKVTSGGVLVDSTGTTAIAEDGNIKDSACTYWSSCSSGKDGNKVLKGGAAAKVASQSSRTIWFNGQSGLTKLSKSAAETVAGGTAPLATYMDTTEDKLESTIQWLFGYDVDDEDKDDSRSDKRADILGDPLHSKPLALNFGSSGSPDIRVMLGTNQGLVHMFRDNDTSVDESWSFIPYELLPNITKLRENSPTGGHSVYGMDLSPVAYVKNGPSGIEKAWVYLGMRRGGSSYYALDVTNPDSPSLMWRITAGTPGFEDLGQTWAEPVITFIPGYGDKPVLIFGGGYDTSYDGTTPNSSPSGRGIYIVDAKTGALVHSFNSTGGSGTKMSGLSHSIPNAVAVLDSDNDGYTDRIYATDLGANVWRIDLPSDDKAKWTAFKFASLGGSTLETNRRFFAEPAVAQTVFTNLSEVTVNDGSTSTTSNTYQNVPYDAVVIGSGNRPTPSSDKTTNDLFFTLQDRNVITRSYDGVTNEIPETLTLDSLYNVTAAAPSPDSDSEQIEFGKKRGWYYDFTNAGEKSLTAALIVDGKVYFTSYVPPAASVSETVCAVSGQGRLYIYDLHKGSRTKAFVELGERLPDTPQIVIPKPDSGEEPYIYIIGVGKGELGEDGEYTGTINVGSGLGANKIYYHIDE